MFLNFPQYTDQQQRQTICVRAPVQITADVINCRIYKSIVYKFGHEGGNELVIRFVEHLQSVVHAVYFVLHIPGPSEISSSFLLAVFFSIVIVSCYCGYVVVGRHRRFSLSIERRYTCTRFTYFFRFRFFLSLARSSVHQWPYLFRLFVSLLDYYYAGGSHFHWKFFVVIFDMFQYTFLFTLFFLSIFPLCVLLLFLLTLRRSCLVDILCGMRVFVFFLVVFVSLYTAVKISNQKR